MKRKVCVITGSRADYGHLRPLIKAIDEDKELVLQLLVTGMHLSNEYGLTYREIQRDGFTIDEKVNIQIGKDAPEDIAHSMGLAIDKFGRSFKRLNPDIIIVLGDRFEIISAVIPAHIARIPVGHLHGGEVTQGAFDDALRHSISKMSQWHFAVTDEYRRRLIQLGEEPSRVFNFGSIGLDNLRQLPLLSKIELEKQLKFKFGKRNLLVTFHPVTLEEKTWSKQLTNLLDVLAGLKDTQLLLTKSNADTGGREINQILEKFAKKHSGRAKLFTSLGQLKYLSAMQYVNGVIGNSSSGINEAPSFKIGTINIGDRQQGRIRAESIIDCKPKKEDIRRAIKKLYTRAFQSKLKNVKNPNGDGKTAQRIIKILKGKTLPEVKKSFYDIKFNEGALVH